MGFLIACPYKKTPRLHELSRKIHTNSRLLLTCDMSRHVTWASVVLPFLECLDFLGLFLARNCLAKMIFGGGGKSSVINCRICFFWRHMTIYDVLWHFMSIEQRAEIVIKCRKLSENVVNCGDVCLLCRFVQGSSRHSSQHLTTPTAHSLKFPGQVWQAWGGVSQIGQADFRRRAPRGPAKLR